MIQVYKQGLDPVRILEEDINTSRQTAEDIVCNVRKSDDEDHDIRVHFSGSANSGFFYFLITKKISWNGSWDAINIKTTQNSNNNFLSFGIRYTNENGQEIDTYFQDRGNELTFRAPLGIVDAQVIVRVKGGTYSFPLFGTTVYFDVSYQNGKVWDPDDYMASNGDITLTPSACDLETELNNAWELTLSHPLDKDGRWKYIEENAVISCTTFVSEKQLFRINKVEKTDTEVQATAYPIFFDSADDLFLMDIRPTNQNGQQALNIMTSGSKYSGESDIVKTGTAYFVRRNMMDAVNGEDSPSFIGTWGGEILYDNFKIIINERVGGDYGAEVRYGKNMSGINYSVDMSDVVTRIVPVAYNGRTMSGSSPWVDSENISKYPKIYTREVKFDDVKLAEDVSGDSEDGDIICQNQTQLDQALTEKCEDMFSAGADLPAVTIEVDMVDLENTEQYKDVKDLVKVSLGDSVYCKNSKLDITTTARVIKLSWDCIKNASKSMTLGDFKYDYFSELSSSLEAVSKVIGPGNTLIAERVNGVLNAINTQLRYQKNVAQKQDVRAILFEDTDPQSPTYGAMCLGTQGFQIADKRTTDGRDWDWTTAFTAKGGYADVIVAGLLSDKNGKFYINLDTGEVHFSDGYFEGEIKATSGTFSGSLNAATGTFSGTLTAAVGGVIAGWNISQNGFTKDKMRIYSSGSINDVIGDFMDSVTKIYPDGIYAHNIYGHIHPSDGYNGRINIMTGPNTMSAIIVEDGIIKRGPAPA